MCVCVPMGGTQTHKLCHAAAVAIDPKLTERDMIRGGLGAGEYDVRIVRDGWVYYVAAARWRRDLGDWWSGAFPLGAVLVQVLWLAFTRGWGLMVRPRWWVVVVRMGDVATWNDVSVRQLRRIHLPRGESPRECVASLVAEIEAGRFRPSA